MALFTDFVRLNSPPCVAERPAQQLCSLAKFAAPTTCAARRPEGAIPSLCVPPLQRRLVRAAAGNLQRSWGGEVPDWELEPHSSDDEIEEELDAAVFGGGNGDDGEGFEFQNALAAVLIGALFLALGNVLIKLGIVAAALVAAAFRYTAVGFVVVVIIALFS